MPSQGKIESASVLLFDFGGTLDSDGIPWKDRFYSLAREEGISAAPAEFDRAFYRATDSLEGTLPADCGFRDTVRAVAQGLAAGLGQENSLARRIGNRFADQALRQLAASAALLSRLCARYRLGVVSNFYGNLAAVCDETGLTPSIGVAVDSARVGFKKPDPRIFRAALDALGADPAQAVFVGDSLRRDMAGARELGMRHIWLRAEGSPSNRRACCPGDTVIARLTQLDGLDL
ncbi:MAG: HAD family hydrolase [Thermoanaerobaculia bacterium]